MDMDNGHGMAMASLDPCESKCGNKFTNDRMTSQLKSVFILVFQRKNRITPFGENRLVLFSLGESICFQSNFLVRFLEFQLMAQKRTKKK